MNSIESIVGTEDLQNRLRKIYNELEEIHEIRRKKEIGENN